MIKDAEYDLDTERGRKDLAEAMFRLNVKSVDARYGKGEAAKIRPLDFRYQEEWSCSEAQAYKYLSCWNYQCSEGDVPNDALYKLMERVCDQIAHHIARDSKEYNEAAWG